MSAFLNMSEASRELGISRSTLNTIICRGELQDYESLVNRRDRLVRVEDVKRLKEGAIRRRPVRARPQVVAA